ncbi:hypothetical protein Cni_G00123 [Canna indica]|uniref:Senescence regulator n=1 Tax=Canna indica TaxID=4628 RepID=A0AAQ3PZU0_9LILI|nr:hypothetical protein Cni_G00123 [Canna indica]
MEELYEADVMWPADGHEPQPRPSNARKLSSSSSRRAWKPLSAPMEVPRMMTRRRSPVAGEGNGGYGYPDEEVEEEEENAAELVPPHLLAASRSRKEAFSLCGEKGRRLKGRELRHVRNSVLRMTGFLEGSMN